MPPSKFEANPMLHLRVKYALFQLASSCSNDYFRACAIINFLANQLVLLNTVTNACQMLLFTCSLAKLCPLCVVLQSSFAV